MRSLRSPGARATCIVFLLLTCTNLLPAPARARDNSLTADISASYNYTERTYGDVNLPSSRPGAEGLETPVIIPTFGRTGDRRDYTVAPGLTFSSKGQTDLFEIRYAPGLVYDDLQATTRVDHAFNLKAEKHFTQRWYFRLDDTYFLGNDPVRETALQNPESAAGAEATAPQEQGTGQQAAQQQAGEDRTLDERVGSRRYWRNTASLLSEYRYGQDSLVGAGYTYEVLRNFDDEPGGYTDYDRHQVMAHVAHRFNSMWLLDVEGTYSKGIFDEPAVVAVTPTEEGGAETEVLRPRTTSSSDLREYIGTIKLEYSWLQRGTLFFSDNSSRTDYDDPLRRDNWTHNLAVGVEYSLDPHSFVTLSAGPSFYKLEGEGWNTDYNVYGRLTRQFTHAELTARVTKSFEVENFSGRGNGLTDTWEAGIDYTYDFTPNLSTVLFTSYRDDRRLQYPYVDTVIGIPQQTSEATEVAGEDETPGELVEGFDYHERLFQVGFSVTYTFMRWYTLSGGYTYAKDETGLEGSADYDEHRVFVQLSVNWNLFRW